MVEKILLCMAMKRDGSTSMHMWASYGDMNSPAFHAIIPRTWWLAARDNELRLG